MGEGWRGPLDLGETGAVIVALFESVVEPKIALSADGLVSVPEYFTIRMRGSGRIYRLLSNPQLFFSLPLVLQKGILAVLHLVMIRGTCECFGSAGRLGCMYLFVPFTLPSSHNSARPRSLSLPPFLC